MENKLLDKIKDLRKTDPQYKEIKKSIKFSFKKYPEKFLYYYSVWKFTEINSPSVDNISSRGNDYHLDHIIPINTGYKYNINPAFIGSKYNLRIIERRHNLIKGSTITDDTLKVLSDFGIDLSKLEPNKIVKYSPPSPPQIEISQSEFEEYKSDNPKSLLYYL